MSEIADFAGQVQGFYKKTAVEQLLLLAWFVEARQQKVTFDGVCLRDCFQQVGLEAPNISQYLSRIASKKPPQVVKDKGGYRLAGSVRRELDKRWGGDSNTVTITKALADLPASLPDMAERAFLAEALACYKVRAYRASIVMVWNLAYDHLTRWLLADADRLAKLNEAIITQYAKKAVDVRELEHFEWLKEAELIELLFKTRILDKTMVQVLKDKLGRRNLAAHPSTLDITQFQADEAVHDLVNNVIRRLK